MQPLVFLKKKLSLMPFNHTDNTNYKEAPDMTYNTPPQVGAYILTMPSLVKASFN